MSTQRNMGVADRLLRVAQQRVHLCCLFDVALEENDAGRAEVASISAVAPTVVPSKPMISN